MSHYSVLLRETINALDIKPDGIYIDGTLGRGGHSAEILKRIPNGHLYAFDLDPVAIEESQCRLCAIDKNFTLIHDNFMHADQVLAKQGITRVDGIVLDLGVSSPQFDDGSRGFSYRFDGPLDMRMDPNQELSAYEVVNSYSYEALVRILWQYGEESHAKAIARSIERHRAIHPIQTTLELVEVIKEALPEKVKRQKGHPAKQTFQALRIEVNHELDSLQQALTVMLQMLAPRGVLAVITFHSLEDRIVKQTFKQHTEIPTFDKRIPLKASELPEPDYEWISKKPILPSAEELEANRRSHSAKLRAIRKKGMEVCNSKDVKED